MRAVTIMEKIVGASEVGRSFGRILREVEVKGDKFVVERNGQPVAALVPLDIYLRWKRERQAFFDQMQEAAERANLSPEEADTLVSQAIKTVRSNP